jgi:catechol-2,3-dioxygenase
MLAIWDLHDDSLGDFDASISRGLGLPVWTNHLAFDAGDLDGLAVLRQRWLDAGYDVAEIDHGWCTSIYVTDPNGIMVEFCATTRTFTDADREEAGRMLAATEQPPLLPEPPTTIYEAATEEATAAS